jgi:hypothetical protein
MGDSSVEEGYRNPTWDDFKIEFENQYYSKYHRKMKEQEFLALRQEGMSVLEYER